MIPTKPPPSFRNPNRWSSAFTEFVTRCLVKNPIRRSTAAELLNVPSTRLLTFYLIVWQSKFGTDINITVVVYRVTSFGTRNSPISCVRLSTRPTRFASHTSARATRPPTPSDSGHATRPTRALHIRAFHRPPLRSTCALNSVRTCLRSNPQRISHNKNVVLMLYCLKTDNKSLFSTKMSSRHLW